MSDKHYSDEDLVARLFGLGSDDAHLAECEECTRRWDQIRGRNELRRPAEIEVPAELLAAQRRAVYARVERRSRRLPLRWLPLPVAALLLVMMIFTVFKPASHKPPKDVISDDQALQEVFTTGSRMEPAGLKPVESLFEEQK